MPAVVYLSFAQLVKQASAAIALILKTVLFEKDNSGLFCYQREAFLQISSICSKLKERFSLAVGSQLRRDPHNFSALELQASQSIPKTMINHICLFSFLHTHTDSARSQPPLLGWDKLVLSHYNYGSISPLTSAGTFPEGELLNRAWYSGSKVFSCLQAAKMTTSTSFLDKMNSSPNRL